MPNRILREGILTSRPVNSLKPHAELLYRRLMSRWDDFGRYDADPSIVRAGCYPLQVDLIREADISRWLTEVESAGLILFYDVDGKRYIQATNVDKPRAQSSKYPNPPPEIQARAYRCAQVNTYVPYSYSDSDSIPPNPRKRGNGRGKSRISEEIPKPKVSPR